MVSARLRSGADEQAAPPAELLTQHVAEEAGAVRRPSTAEEPWQGVPAVLPEKLPWRARKVRAMMQHPWIRAAAPGVRDLALEVLVAGVSPDEAVELVQ